MRIWRSYTPKLMQFFDVSHVAQDNLPGGVISYAQVMISYHAHQTPSTVCHVMPMCRIVTKYKGILCRS
jgi:hypothetical protein